jgi:hypothetical protein
VRGISRKRLLGLSKALASAILLLIAWRAAGTETGLREAIGRMDVGLLAGAALVFAAGQAVAALRLFFVLRRLCRPAPFAAVLRAHFVGLGFNQVLPTGFGGDVVKILVLRRAGDTRRVVRAVLLARGFGLVALLFATAALFPFYGRVLSETGPLRPLAGVSAGLLLVGLAAAGASRWRRLARPRRRPVRFLFLLLRDARRFSAPRPLLEQAATSAAVVLSVVLCFDLLGGSLGHAGNAATYLTVVPPVIVAMHLPISFGGWGIREVGAVTLLPLGGMDGETAFLVSLLYGVVLLASGAAGFILWQIPGPRGDAAGRRVPRPGPALEPKD